MNLQECINFATMNPLCSLATADGDQPQVRIVMLMFADESGFYFETMLNAPAERVMELLYKEGAEVYYHDPYVPTFRVGGNVVLKEPVQFENVDLSADLLAHIDCTVFITGHKNIDYTWLVEHSRVVVDTVNVTHNVPGSSDKILRLGAPHFS